MSIKVFVPGHITGFFNIENNPDPLKNGSCGAGFLLNKGVETKIKKSSSGEFKVNKGNDIVINEILKLFDLDEGFKITQDIQVPIGAGFGTSASSALGLAIGISKLTGYDYKQACQNAHIAEINLGSGLGDVIAELGSGIVLRTKAGAPFIGEIKSFNYDKIYVASKTFGEISTSSVINNKNSKKIINKNGLIMKEKFLKDFSVENFLKLSLEFSKSTDLMSREVTDLINYFNSFDDILGSSMAMLGNTAFAFSYDKSLLKSLEIEDLHIYEIDNFGIKIC